MYISGCDHDIYNKCDHTTGVAYVSGCDHDIYNMLRICQDVIMTHTTHKDVKKIIGEAHTFAQTNAAKCIMCFTHHTCPRLHSLTKLTVGLNKNPKYLVIDLTNLSFLFLFHICLVVCTLFPRQLELSHDLTSSL